MLIASEKDSASDVAKRVTVQMNVDLPRHKETPKETIAPNWLEMLRPPLPSHLPLPPLLLSTHIDTYIQNLITKGRTTEDILQTLKICYEDNGKDVAAATTFFDTEGF